MRMTRKRPISAAILVCALALAGCMKTATGTNPPAPPTPPQVTVANSMLALANALSGATDALIACRQQAKCAAADVGNAETVITAIAMAGKQIDAELVSKDTWDMQKVAILKIVSQAGISQAIARVSPSTKLVIQAVITLFDNVSLAVGGPQI